MSFKKPIKTKDMFKFERITEDGLVFHREYNHPEIFDINWWWRSNIYLITPLGRFKKDVFESVFRVENITIREFYTHEDIKGGNDHHHIKSQLPDYQAQAQRGIVIFDIAGIEMLGIFTNSNGIDPDTSDGFRS